VARSTPSGSKEGLHLAALDLYRQRYATPLIDLLCAGSWRA
jgi:TetR/AcrR family transcriptional repressor of nem operon